jgi:hypothetical protein
VAFFKKIIHKLKKIKMQKGKTDFIVTLAKMLPQEILINKMEEAINSYKEAKLLNKDDVFNELMGIQASAHMFIINCMEEDADQIIEDMEKVHQRYNFFENSNNAN